MKIQVRWDTNEVKDPVKANIKTKVKIEVKPKVKLQKR